MSGINMQTRTCKTCKKEKLVSEFPKMRREYATLNARSCSMCVDATNARKAAKAANAQRLRDERDKAATENMNSTINRFLRGEFAR